MKREREKKEKWFCFVADFVARLDYGLRSESWGKNVCECVGVILGLEVDTRLCAWFSDDTRQRVVAVTRDASRLASSPK